MLQNRTNKEKLLIALLILLVGVGTIVRIANLFHVGFMYDTFTTQYDWGRNGFEMGIFGFWKNYGEMFDYLSGSLVFLTVLEGLGKVFGGGWLAFIVMLKLSAWLGDLLLTLCVYLVARKTGKTKLTSALIAGFAYVIPSVWFISAVWGQIDSIVASLGLFALLYTHQVIFNPALAKRKKLHATLAAVAFCLGFWVKMQALILIPFFILLYLYQFRKNVYSVFVPQIITFLSFFAVFTVPFALVNIQRTGSTLAAFFNRYDTLSNAASNVWPMLFGNGSLPASSDAFLAFGPLKLSFSVFAVLVYVGIMLPLILVAYGSFKKNISISSILDRLNNYQLSLFQLISLVFVNASTYFIFFAKMHSRYLHFGIFASLLLLGVLSVKSSRFIRYFAWVALLNLGYFVSNIAVYSANTFRTDAHQDSLPWIREIYYRYESSWVKNITDSGNFDWTRMGSLLIFVSFVVLTIMIFEDNNQLHTKSS